jgi:hypothetical protein
MSTPGARRRRHKERRMEQLHPNLAQLVAARDEILERWRAGNVDWSDARRQMLALVARDDQGVLWMLNPDDGAWYRRTRDGRLERDVPPSFGVATPTAFDLSAGDPFRDPRRRIVHDVVDPNALRSHDSLVGATQRPAPLPPSTPGRPVSDTVRALIVGAVAVLLLVALWVLWR